MIPTEKKMKIMQAYLEGKDIAWAGRGINTCEGIHNVKDERDNLAPIWNWGDTSYEIVIPKFDETIYINTQIIDTGKSHISGLYKSKGHAESCSGKWNDRVGVKVRILEVD